MASSQEFRIFGSEASPYSIKVRAYFRWKRIPHVWLARTGRNQEEYRKYAKLPIVPTVATPEGKGLQDSTPIIEMLEAQFPTPAVHPPGDSRFLSELLEEFGDEWGNKWMFHFRWAREEDQDSASRRITAEMLGAPETEPQVQQAAEGIKQRMVGRPPIAIGSNEVTAPIIEATFADALQLLEAHLAGRPFLFGSRPAFADFGLAPQLYQALVDPTAGRLLRGSAPAVAAWAERMLDPQVPAADGDAGFEAWEALAPTLEPFLREHVALFLRWSAANAQALASGAKELRVDLGSGRHWQQTVGGPQRYHAKSLTELRRKFAAAGTPGLRAILERCGCLEELVDTPKAAL